MHSPESGRNDWIKICTGTARAGLEPVYFTRRRLRGCIVNNAFAKLVQVLYDLWFQKKGVFTVFRIGFLKKIPVIYFALAKLCSIENMILLLKVRDDFEPRRERHAFHTAFKPFRIGIPT